RVLVRVRRAVERGHATLGTRPARQRSEEVPRPGTDVRDDRSRRELEQPHDLVGLLPRGALGAVEVAREALHLGEVHLVAATMVCMATVSRLVARSVGTGTSRSGRARSPGAGRRVTVLVMLMMVGVRRATGRGRGAVCGPVLLVLARAALGRFDGLLIRRDPVRVRRARSVR